jgi:hypothetical protein
VGNWPIWWTGSQGAGGKLAHIFSQPEPVLSEVEFMKEKLAALVKLRDLLTKPAKTKNK